MDTSLSPKSSSSALPSNHEHTLKKILFNIKMQGRYCNSNSHGYSLFVPGYNLYLYILFGCFRHKSGGQKASLAKCNSFQDKQKFIADSLLKPPVQTPANLRGFVWIMAELKLSRNLGILSQKLFHYMNLYSCIPDRLTWKKWTLLYSWFFFNTQLSWFSRVTNAKTHFKKVSFKVPITSFFWDLPVFPSGCWQHCQLAFHSPSWLVPFIPELGDLQTSYKDSFCTFNLNFLPITQPITPNPTMRVQLDFRG